MKAQGRKQKGESMSGILSGKSALVTGGATLFGRAVVAELAAEGANVLVADIEIGRAHV